MNPLVIEKLNAAAALLDGDGWTTASLARDKAGESCQYWEPEACSFCAMGALMRVCGLNPTDSVQHYEKYPVFCEVKAAFYKEAERLEKRIKERGLVEFNDYFAQPGEVQSLFQRVAEILRQRMEPPKQNLPKWLQQGVEEKVDATKTDTNQ
jgi:hypothetical protein